MKKWFLIILIIIFAFSALVIYFKAKIADSKGINNGIMLSASNKQFYDQLCPDIEFVDSNRLPIRLSDYVGSVIIIKFSRFYKNELPELVFLNYLADKYASEKVKLFIINGLGGMDINKVNDYAHFSCPLIIDNGDIVRAFDAMPSDLIIINKEHRVKFKLATNDRNIIHREILRWSKGDIVSNKNIDIKLSDLLDIKYVDAITLKPEFIFKCNGKRRVIVMFPALCATCSESLIINSIIDLMNDPNVDSNTEYLVIFGAGNTAKGVAEYVQSILFDKSRMAFGLIAKSKNIPRYYDLFESNNGARVYLLSEANVLIHEGTIGSKSDIDQIKKVLL
jgi:hypothetical protein